MWFTEGYNIQFWHGGEKGTTKEHFKQKEEKSPMEKNPSLQIRVKFNCEFVQGYYQN